MSRKVNELVNTRQSDARGLLSVNRRSSVGHGGMFRR
jgi:hypothetical protein